MGDVTRPLPTTPAPASLRAAGASGVVTIITDPLPVAGQEDGPGRWQADWQFRSPPCRPIEVGAGGCPAVDADSLKDWDPQQPSIWEGKPFGMEVQLECSLPANQADLAAEGRAALERGMVPQVAQELYSGAIARNEIAAGNTAWDQNRWLTRADDPVSELTIINEDTDPVPLAGAIGLLEQYLACCSDVGRGVIHVPPSVVPPITSLGTMLAPPSTGGARFSPSGHVLVADCGYTGEGPGDADDGPSLPPDGVMWLYATGPIQVRVSLGYKLDSIEDVAAWFLPDNNTVAAELALGMAVWGCCHAAVAVDVSPFGLTLNPGS
jgi:hypothetical protein